LLVALLGLALIAAVSWLVVVAQRVRMPSGHAFGASA
jgi:hypothetical protein